MVLLRSWKIMHTTLDRFPEANRVICKEQVAELAGYHPATIDRLVASGKFPAPFRIGGRKLGWRYGTITSFLANLETEAQAKAPMRIAREAVAA
jgi:predicted DNA-binding transcriptional regulator AlpA